MRHKSVKIPRLRVHYVSSLALLGLALAVAAPTSKGLQRLPRAMSVFCWPGDTLNGTLNGSLSIPAGGFGVFLKVDATLDWRAASFT